MLTAPPEAIPTLVVLFVIKESPPEVADNPVPEDPVNVSDGAVCEPAGN